MSEAPWETHDELHVWEFDPPLTAPEQAALETFVSARHLPADRVTTWRNQGGIAWARVSGDRIPERLTPERA